MNLPDFDFYAPESVQDTCKLLACFGTRAKVISGGTDMMVKMKHAQLSPEVLVSIKNFCQLTNVYYEKGKGVVIGAMATHNDIVNSPLLKEKYFSVCEAAHHMANNQIRNIGTIGGNIVSAVPSADFPPLLIALGASVKLIGCNGERTIALEDFFTGPNESVIAQDEILTEVIIPDQPATGSTYIKFGLRRSGALAVVGVAAAVTMEGDVCKDVRIALGAVAPVPMRAQKAEDLLKGKVITEEILKEVGKCAAVESKPISDIRGSAEYRRDMVRVFTKRALSKAISEGHV